MVNKWISLVALALICLSFGQECPDKCICANRSSVMECRDISEYPDAIPQGITAIAFDNCNFAKITTLPEGYRNITELFIRSSAVTTIEDDAFIHLTKLEILVIEGNSLTLVLRPEVFQGLSAVNELKLGNNLIKSLQDDVFKMLPGLTRLDLSLNRGIELGDRALVNKEDSDITTVSLNGCGLTEVPTRELSLLPKLSVLELEQNLFVDSFSGDAFEGLTELTSLNLDSSKINTIHEDTFQNQRKLEKLYLSNNNISSVSNHAFAPFRDTIKVVHLENNQLQTLSEELLPWEQLTEIRLGGNHWHCDCRVRWMTAIAGIDPLDKDNVTCSSPDEFKNHPAYNATMAQDCHKKSYVGIYIAIPLIIILTGIIIYIIVKICQTRRKEKGKSVRYSAVYKDTVYKEQPGVQGV